MIQSSRTRALAILFTMVISILSLAANIPLSPQALANEVELYPFEEILPSPDGKWLAFECSDPTRKIQLDYEGQRFTKSGRPHRFLEPPSCVGRTISRFEQRVAETWGPEVTFVALRSSALWGEQGS